MVIISLGWNWWRILAALIHSTFYVSPKTTVLEGRVVLPKTIVNIGVEVRRGCIFDIGYIVAHDTVIEEGTISVLVLLSRERIRSHVWKK